MHTVPVHIRAMDVFDNGNGTFTVVVAGRLTTQEESMTLERLFPNTFMQVERLLAQESLITAIATPAEVSAPATKETGSVKGRRATEVRIP